MSSVFSIYKHVKPTMIVLVGALLFLFAGAGKVSGQITQVGTAQTNYAAGSTTLSLSKPTNVAVGDIMIVSIVKYVSAGNNTTNPSLAGWTVIGSGLGGNTRRRGAILYRIVDGTEGSSFAFSLSGGTSTNYAEGVLVAYTNVDFASSFDVTPGTITAPGSTGTTVSPTGVTTVTPNALILQCGLSFSSISTARTFSTWSVATSPALTELYDVVGTQYATVGLATGVQSTAGATGLGSISVSGTSYLGGIILALRPLKIFRSLTTGNWNSTSTWQQSTDGGVNWVAATTTPVTTDGSVTIRNGHTVTVSASVSADDVTVDAGGQVTVSSGQTLTVANGAAANDMIVNGTLVNSGTVTTTGILLVNAGGAYQHAQNGGTIPTATWNTTSTCNITGITNATTLAGLGQTFGNFTWNCTNQATGNFYLATNINVLGNFTVLSTGATNDPNNFSLRMSNTATGYTMNVGGNFVVSNTAAFKMNNSTGACSLNIGGNLIINGAGSNFCIVSGAVNSVVNLSGSFNLSAGTFTMSEDANTGTLNVARDFSFASGTTITESSTGSGNIVFNGTTQQMFSSGGTVSNIINFTVNNGAILQMGTGASPSTITGAGSFVLSAGATLGVTSPNGIVSAIGTASGNIQTTVGRTFTAGASYIYNGTSAQVTGTGLTQNTPANLTINNFAGVSLSSATTISGILTLVTGTLTTTTYSLTLTNTATTAVVGGSATSYVNGPLKWTLPSSLASGSTYNFPIGVGAASPSFNYYPFSLVNPTTGATPTVQVEAKQGNPGGSAGTGLSAISTTEYWQLTTTGTYTNSAVSMARPTAISPYTVVATCGTVNGSYSNLGGVFDNYGVYNSGTTVNKFFRFGTSTSASLDVDKTVLYGFNYPLAYGPSSEQSFKVSGVALTTDVVVTPSNSNFEISTVSGGIFQTTPITLTKSGSNNVSSTIYVRLKSGLVLGNYNSSVTVSTTGLSSKTVNLYGSVSPTITASGGGSYCAGNTITLGSTGGANWYWTGPNNYYSTTQSPTVTTNATVAMSGTYTVSGSTPSGTTLLTNGDFELGDNYFTSAYTYFTTKDMGESRYAIVKLPSTVHSNFCSDCGDTIPTPGAGYQMVVNGAGTEQTIWAPTSSITVTPYTNYQFTYWVQTVVNGNDPSPSKLQLYVNGVAAGPIYTADPTTGLWTLYKYNWYSGASNTANLALKNENFATGGNDFALDGIRFEQVYTSTASVDVTVLAANAPASVSVSASANPVNAGTSVTYTATPTNGGTGPTYQWSVNGVNVSGATGTTYTYIPINGDIVKCTMTSSSACLTGSNPVSSSVTMVVNSVVYKNYWVGTNSTDWGTASNWSAGYVPGDNDEVEFSTIKNNSLNAKRNLVLDIDRRVSRLIDSTSLPIRQLIIPAARSLTVSDTIRIPTTYPDSSRIYIQTDANGSQQNGTLIFHNIGKVYASVEMYARGSYSALGASYGGNTYHYSWQYFGIPVTSVIANPTFYGSYVRSWYEPGTNMTNHWKSFTNDSIARAFYGYELTQQTQKVIVFQGQLVNSDWTSPVLAKTGTAGFPGQYVFANPYTAAINMGKFITTNLPYDTDGSVYLYSTGSYAEWGNNGVGGTDGTSPGQYQVCTNAAGATQISSMQAVLMQVGTGSLGTSKIAFRYSDVEKTNVLQRTKGQIASPASSLMTNIRIDVAGTRYTDRIWLFSDSIFTSHYDKGWDGRKLFGIALAPQLFVQEEDGSYQIACKKNINNTVLGFQSGIDSEYTFTFTNANLDKSYSAVYLIDSVTSSIIDITRSGTTYTFNVDTLGVYTGRFKIIARNIEEPIKGNSSKIRIFKAAGQIFVDNSSSEKGEFSLFDVAGRCISRSNFNANSVSAVSSVDNYGIYIARAATSTDKATERFIIDRQ
ncbi:MAG: T9SS type A sorting domain-containing protein [Paludibacter sp.]|nr:T9SS type A sorting domain-containing protein [Paludibacter sp.]